MGSIISYSHLSHVFMYPTQNSYLCGLLKFNCTLITRDIQLHNKHSIVSITIWNEQDMFFGIKGVTIWFRLIKPICDLELKIFGYCFFFFELQKHILILHLTHPKSQKSFKLVLRWTRYVFLKWRGSLFDSDK